MAGTGAIGFVDWIAFFAFVVLLAASILAETAWLKRKGWASGGRALGFVTATDFLGLGIGMSIVGAAMLVLFMMVMGPAGRGGSSPDWAYVLVSIIGMIVPVTVLILLKRVGISLFKMQAGRPAWTFSFTASLLFVVVVFVLPVLLFWLLVTLA